MKTINKARLEKVVLPFFEREQAEYKKLAGSCLERYNHYRDKKWPAYPEYQSYLDYQAIETSAGAIAATIELWLRGEYPLLNVYLVDAGDISVVADTIDFGSDEVGSIYFSMYEDVRCIEFVACETRGQARAMVADKHDLEFTDKMSIIKFAQLPVPYGIIRDEWGLMLGLHCQHVRD